MNPNETKYAAIRAAQIERWRRPQTAERIARELNIPQSQADQIAAWVFADFSVIPHDNFEYVEEWREKHNVSRELLAREAGVSEVTLWSIEKSKHKPQPRVIKRVMEAIERFENGEWGEKSP